MLAVTQRPPERIAFLLLPRFSLMSLGCALDALALANQHGAAAELRSGRGRLPLYDTLLCSVDGRAVASGSGAAVAVDLALAHLPPLDALFVVSDAPLPQTGHDDAVAALRSWGEPGQGARLVGGIGTGAWLLARAGLLRGHRATLQGAYAPLMAELFPDVVVSTNVFEADRHRLCCAGGTAAFDMMLHHVGATHGADVALQLRAGSGLEQPRGANEPQRVPLAARIGGGQPKLTDAVALMEANVEEPLATEDIARLVGVSRRQLERLFKQTLDSLPSRYYLELRLARARSLLQQTSQSVLQVGLACGFSSGPHFSNAYRAHFGITPREQRSRRAASPIGDPR